MTQSKGSDQTLTLFYKEIAEADTIEKLQECISKLHATKETQGLTTEPYFHASVKALLQKLQMQPELLENDLITKSVERLILPYYNCHSDSLLQCYLEMHQAVSKGKTVENAMKFLKKARQGLAFEENFDTFCSIMQHFHLNSESLQKTYNSLLLLPVRKHEHNEKKFSLIISWLSKIPANLVKDFLLSLFKTPFLAGPNSEWIKKIGNALLERKDLHGPPLVQYTQKVCATNENIEDRDSLIQWWLSEINNRVESSDRLHIFQVLLMALNLPGMNISSTFVDHIIYGILQKQQETRLYKECTKFLVLKYPEKAFLWLCMVHSKAGKKATVTVFQECVQQNLIGTYTVKEQNYIQPIHDIFKTFSKDEMKSFEAAYHRQLTEYQRKLSHPF